MQAREGAQENAGELVVGISVFGSTLRVSESYATDIRAGRHRPHPSHWQALAELAGISDAS
jgi:hypothetical protein